MKSALMAFGIVVVMVMLGCQKEPAASIPPATPSTQAKTGRWSVELVKEMAGEWNIPECVLADGSGTLYISNIDTQTEGYWKADGKGYLTLADDQGQVKQLRWVDSTPAFVLDAPKGMALCGGKLYFNDITRLKRCNAVDGSQPEVVNGVAGEQLNDLATDGQSVFSTDTKTGAIYQLMADGQVKTLKGPDGVNGVTCWKGRIFAVSWGQHDLYEIDPAGQKAAAPFGLAEHFTSLDGIEVLDDGTFIVSDFPGNKVCAVTPDGKTVYTLIEMESPADIGIDRAKGLLFVPQFLKSKVFIYKLKQ